MGVTPLMTERVTQRRRVPAPHTYYAEGVTGGEEERER